MTQPNNSDNPAAETNRFSGVYPDNTYPLVDGELDFEQQKRLQARQESDRTRRVSSDAAHAAHPPFTEKGPDRTLADSLLPAEPVAFEGVRDPAAPDAPAYAAAQATSDGTQVFPTGWFVVADTVPRTFTDISAATPVATGDGVALAPAGHFLLVNNWTPGTALPTAPAGFTLG